MLPKENRLRNTKDIGRVLRYGEGARECFLFLKFLENGLGVSRFAFIVSKKTSPKAVQRNNIKRRLRDIVRKRILQIKTGFDLVMMAQKGAGSAKFKEMEQAVVRLLEKTKLILT